MIVIDASVLTGYLLDHEAAVTAVEHDLDSREYEPVHAPEVIDPETVNALRHLSFRGWVTVQRATQAVSDLGKVRLIRYPHAPLTARIWQLRDALTAYDAAYVALAEALPDARLLTGDRPLATAASKLLGADRVVLAA